MKALFCHDHMFSKFGGNFYSPGKLDYQKLSYYCKFFSKVMVVSRSRDVSVISKSLQIATGDGVEVKSLPNIASIHGLLYIASIRRALKSMISNTDAVIVRIPSEIGLMAESLAREVGKPVLCEVVASAYDCLWNRGDIAAKLYAPVLERRMRKACYRARYITYVTESYLQGLYPTRGVSAGLSDVDITSVGTSRSFPSRKKYSVSVIGNPDLKLKGIRVAVKALKIVRSKGYDVILRVLGGKGEGYVAQYGSLPDWVVFDGIVVGSENVINWLDRADVYVQPSLTEGMPRSLLEAMSRGIPCLGSRVGGITELLPQNASFRAGDHVGMAECLVRLLSDKQLYIKSSEHSINTATPYLRNQLGIRRDSFYQQFRNYCNTF